jgi:hypothetical protein
MTRQKKGESPSPQKKNFLKEKKKFYKKPGKAKSHFMERKFQG